jgi:exonuclease SbcC
MAGGIKLDSLFIDEGFGTLDSNSLSKAMKILEELTNGDKLVGIISHVESLKERIPNKILVKKNPDGISQTQLVLEN